tara:strand:+ start:2882 stop:3247 length:366 start_codon:yes stop_codon:yes gene_type:complete
MGRYYSGDIEGKFAFAIQSSQAPERFGARECEPSYMDYYVSPDSVDEVRKEVQSIETKHADQIKHIEKMFDENNGYNDSTMEKYGVTREGLSEYADLRLGRQILEYLEDNPHDGCSIQAEL